MNTEPRKVTARDVTISLFWSLQSASQILIPRYTPRDWWECDLWRLTKADLVDEYEIKMSVADFRADAKKRDDNSYEIDPTTRRYTKAPTTVKHDLLAGPEKGPNRFWFVVPSEIHDRIDVPDYAGLMVFSGRCRPFVEKQAPKRHDRKWEGNKLQIFRTFYHRYWTHEAGAKTDIAPSCEPIDGVDDEPSGVRQTILL